MGMIVKLAEDKYVDWSGCCDAPATGVMSRSDMEEFVKDQELREMRLRPGEIEKMEGREKEITQELFDLRVKQRLDRIEKNGIEKNGTSSMHGSSAKSLVAGNRAGPKETCLTIDEIIEAYTWTPEKKGKWPFSHT